MGAAHVAALDVRRSTGSRDEAGVTWRAGLRRSFGIVLHMRQACAGPDRHRRVIHVQRVAALPDMLAVA
ncbi:MAG: hypothetical protein K0S42_2805 [Microvirga sp.]|nr:hypothetical protein [Microvirga sp.]